MHSREQEHLAYLMKYEHVNLTFLKIDCWWIVNANISLILAQVNHMHGNILPIAYGGQSNGQSSSSYSSDDLPKAVVMNLNQGSMVMSMDFHPVQQILLLG